MITAYFAAWNELRDGPRRKMLEESLSADVELVDPLGRWSGIDGVMQRIEQYQNAAPGTSVVPTSGVDAHNDVVRYAWDVVDESGTRLLEGLDVAERAADGRLRRIVMFHGPLPREL